MIDPKYEMKIATAIFKAIAETSIVADPTLPEGKTAVMRSSEVSEACLIILAMFLAMSEVTATPRSTRECVEKLSKKLRSQIAEMKRCRASGDLDFFKTIPENGFH